MFKVNNKDHYSGVFSLNFEHVLHLFLVFLLLNLNSNCLLGYPLGIRFRTLSNIYDRAFYKNSQRLNDLSSHCNSQGFLRIPDITVLQEQVTCNSCMSFRKICKITCYCDSVFPVQCLLVHRPENRFSYSFSVLI